MNTLTIQPDASGGRTLDLRRPHLAIKATFAASAHGKRLRLLDDDGHEHGVCEVEITEPVAAAAPAPKRVGQPCPRCGEAMQGTCTRRCQRCGVTLGCGE